MQGKTEGSIAHILTRFEFKARRFLAPAMQRFLSLLWHPSQMCSIEHHPLLSDCKHAPFHHSTWITEGKEKHKAIQIDTRLFQPYQLFSRHCRSSQLQTEALPRFSAANRGTAAILRREARHRAPAVCNCKPRRKPRVHTVLNAI